MSKENPIIDSALLEKTGQEILNRIKRDSSNLALLKEIFNDDSTEITDFLTLQKENPLAAATLFYKNLGKSSAGDKKKVEAIKKDVQVIAALIQKEVGVLSDEIQSEEIKKEGTSEKPAEPQKKKAVEKTTTTKKETLPKAEAKVDQKKESEELLKKIRDIELEQAGYSKEKIEKMSEKEKGVLLNEIHFEKEKKTRSADISTARQFLRNKLSRREIDALPSGMAVIKKAEELAKKTISEIKEYLIERTETNEELDRILTPGKIEIINKMLEDKSIPIITHEKPDLDSKAAIYILKMIVGNDERVTTEIKKGGTAPKGILIDVGNSEKITTITEDRWETDHHFAGRGIKTSSAETMLGTLERTGHIKKVEPWMREFVTFVTDVDNMSYPRQDKEWFAGNYAKTLLGLREMLSTETLADFFKSGKSPYEALTEEEMLLEVTDAKGTKQPLINLIEKVNWSVQKSIENTERYERRSTLSGQKNFSNEFGKVLFFEPKDGDKSWNITLGSHAAYNMGYDTYVRYEPTKKFYFVSYPGRDLSPFMDRIKHKDPNAKIIRGSMVMSAGDMNDKKAEVGLHEQQLVNYLGLDIPKNPKAVEVTVEYETSRILQSQYQVRGVYAKRLQGVQDLFTANVEQLQKNIDACKAELDRSKTVDNAKDFERKEKLLNASIATLLLEQSLWENKVKLAESLKGKPYTKFWSLVDTKKFGNRGPQTPAKNESATVETIEASVEDVTAQLEEVTAQYDAVSEKLKSTEGTLEETRELMVQHYNLWQLGLFLQNGGQGEQPADLTWIELKPILAGKRDATKQSAPETILEASAIEPAVETPISPTIETTPSEEILNVAETEVTEEEPLIETPKAEEEKATEYVKPETLLTPEDTTTETIEDADEQEEASHEQILSPEQLTDFIRTSITEAFKKESTDARKFENFILSPSTNGQIDFIYTIKTSDSTGIKIKGLIDRPNLFSRNGYCASIKSKDISYSSDENILSKMIKSVGLSLSSEKREEIMYQEESRIGSILKKAIQDRFGDKLPVPSL